MTCDAYDLMQEELAKAKLLAVVARGERDYEAGNFVEGAAFTQELRNAYGL